MSSNEDILKLLERVYERSESNKDLLQNLDKKLDLHIQKTEYELHRINEHDDIQNQLLDKHIAGVQTLRKLQERYEENMDKRFTELEEPAKWIRTTVKIVLSLFSAAAAISAVGHYLGKW